MIDDILFSACIALVEELNWLTGITSPKKKIQVGSFHLDSKGNSGAREVSKLDSVSVVGYTVGVRNLAL